MCETKVFLLHTYIGFLIIWRSRSVYSVNRTVKIDTHQKENAFWRWAQHYFVSICKSAFWHSTVRICLEISSDGTENHTCKRPPGKCDLVFFLFDGQILSWDSSDGTGNATFILQYKINVLFHFSYKNLIFVVKRISSYFFNIWKFGVYLKKKAWKAQCILFIYLFICKKHMLTCNMRFRILNL